MTKDEVIERVKPAPGCVLARAVRPPVSILMTGEVIATAPDAPAHLHGRRIKFSEKSSPSFVINGDTFYVVRADKIVHVGEAADDKG